MEYSSGKFCHQTVDEVSLTL
jgi:hypothetical protein